MTHSDRDGSERRPHEFTEDVADASMCICGVPALMHDLIVALSQRGPEPTEDRAAALAEAIRADNEQVRADDFQKWLNRPQPTEEPS